MTDATSPPATPSVAYQPAYAPRPVRPPLTTRAKRGAAAAVGWLSWWWMAHAFRPASSAAEVPNVTHA